ncbi:MAG: class I SAM-dependent methyltransferase [Candidatus Delongbacteria bacterium]|nr:class I SAM-dependent methyltransferase [Candidatus Delongbacteria bacterium]
MKLNNKENIKAWSENAKDFGSEFFKNYKDEGDFWHKELLNQNILDCLGDIKGRKVLDAGCGEGYFSRIMAKKGAIVTGLEPSNMIDFAIRYEKVDKLGIEYLKEDICSFTQRTEFYDAVIAINVFMDIPDFETALKICVESLKENGVLVFSILHPCFTPVILDHKTNEYKKEIDFENKGHIEIEEYFKEVQVKQTNDVYNHRTLSTYLNQLISKGMIIEKIIESQLDLKFEKDKPNKDYHIPTFLIVKSRKRG